MRKCSVIVIKTGYTVHNVTIHYQTSQVRLFGDTCGASKKFETLHELDTWVLRLLNANNYTPRIVDRTTDWILFDMSLIDTLRPEEVNRYYVQIVLDKNGKMVYI